MFTVDSTAEGRSESGGLRHRKYSSLRDPTTVQTSGKMPTPPPHSKAPQRTLEIKYACDEPKRKCLAVVVAVVVVVVVVVFVVVSRCAEPSLARRTRPAPASPSSNR